MKTCVFFCVALTGVAMVEAQLSPYPVPTTMPPYPAPVPAAPAPIPAPAPAPTPDPGPWIPTWIPYDQVQAFDEPEPVTTSATAGVKYKPELTIESGCQPFPAVDAQGRTSLGLEPKGGLSDMCWERPKGTQIYGRSIWFRGVYAIMYAWYFPKDMRKQDDGHTHDWESVVVWLNNPAVDYPEVMALSWWEWVGYNHEAPPNYKHMDGTRAQFTYHSPKQRHHTLYVSDRKGESQPLIMWEQLTENARRALNTVNWGPVSMPMNDANFQPYLEKAWPFDS